MLALFSLIEAMTVPKSVTASVVTAGSHTDRTRIDHEIDSYLEAIALYERKVESSDAQLSEFAQRILPQLKRHLALLRSLKACAR